MNYYAFCGYWFYAGPAGTAAKIASFFASWGLLEVAPIIGGIGKAVMMYYMRRRRT